MEKLDEHRIWCKKVLFIVQLFVLIAMLATSIANIILKTGNLPLWTSLLGASLGFLLPTPRFKFKFIDKKESPNPLIPSSIVS